MYSLLQGNKSNLVNDLASKRNSCDIDYFKQSDWEFNLDMIDSMDIDLLSQHLQSVPKEEASSSCAVFLSAYLSDFSLKMEVA